MDLIARIGRFLADPGADDFEELALEVFRFQFDRIEPYRRLCRQADATPETVERWEQVPPVPTLAFKSLALHAAPPREVFRSSGTTGERTSVHHHPYPELYRLAVEQSFPRFCLPGLPRPPMLALVPSPAVQPDSSLGFMVAHVLARWGGDESLWAFGPRGVDVPAARSWLGARQRSGEPVLLLATSFALVQLLEALERRRLRFRLPLGSVIFDTGGTKGRSREVSREELEERLATGLGVPRQQVVREYGMTELSSQCYTTNLVAGPPHRFHPPHWLRFRILDPQDLHELAAGETGLLCCFDLANAGSAAHVLTEDLAHREGEGFALEGRASGAELRGCSLTVEQLAG